MSVPGNWWETWNWDEVFPVKWLGDYPVILVPDLSGGVPEAVYLFGEPEDGRVLDIRNLQESRDSG
jgi:hypothetical protein